MKRTLVIIVGLAVVTLGGAIVAGVFPVAQAEKKPAQVQSSEQTTTFLIDKMTCAACPITVRKAMERVEGVKSVKVDFDAKTATVVFDPSTTTIEQIGSVSTKAGYPAKPIL